MAPDTQTREVGVRKREILDAALTLFSERGYTGTGMEHIAAAVGVAPSSLYNHWRSKQDLLQVIMETQAEEVRANFEVNSQDTHSPAEALRAVTNGYVRYHVTHMRATRVAIRERSSLEAEAEAKLTVMNLAYVQLWQDLVDRGVSAGQFDVASTQITTYALLELGVGVSQWIDSVAPMSLDDIASAYEQIALRIVGYRA